MKALLAFPQLILALRGEVSSLRSHNFSPLVAESQEGFKIRRHG
jgi:hypothetical protein